MRYEHKFGTDIFAYDTMVGAEKGMLKLVEEWKDEFITHHDDPWYNSSLEEIAESWTEVTGESESLYIEEIPIHVESDDKGPSSSDNDGSRDNDTNGLLEEAVNEIAACFADNI